MTADKMSIIEWLKSKGEWDNKGVGAWFREHQFYDSTGHYAFPNESNREWNWYMMRAWALVQPT